MGGKILLQKYPGSAHFGPWNVATLGPLAQFLGVEAEKCRRLAEVKGMHAESPARPSAAMATRFPGRGTTDHGSQREKPNGAVGRLNYGST